MNREYIIICNAASILAAQCDASATRIIEKLTGYLWDEEEAVGIKAVLTSAMHSDGEGRYDLDEEFTPHEWIPGGLP